MLHRPLATLALLAALGCLLAASAAPVPAAATPEAPTPAAAIPAVPSPAAGSAAPPPASNELTAVLELAQSPASAARLTALAATRLHPSQAHARQAAVASLRPAASTRAAAERFAARRGLRVVRADAWSVTVAAAPAWLAAAFGSTLATTVAHGHRYRHATSTPTVPAVLRGAVVGVVGLDERPAMHRHTPLPGAPAGTQDGDSLRRAYGVPDSWRGAGVTVATFNLSGWDSSDLDTYARATGSTAHLTEIPIAPVTPADVRTPVDGGDIEVALDAEALLATAPEAAQRAYFGDNSPGGVTALMDQAATDAEAHLFQVFSTSWGSCEKYTDRTSRAAYSRDVARMVAAGVTVFAASGDSGGYDCADRNNPGPDNTTPAVDFPASDANVVGVGGTTLPASNERGWGTAPDPMDVSSYQGDGSGGGFSATSLQPAFQQGLGLTGRRSVPDVASEADPSTGLAILYQGRVTVVGGTSLASPTWAGFTAVALSATSRPTVGFGNVLPALYAHPSAFRDITTGTNHVVNAGRGYDQVTGLGVPRWSRIGPLLAGSPYLEVADYTRNRTMPVTVAVPVGTSVTAFRVGEGPAYADCIGLTAGVRPTQATLAATASGTPTQGLHTLSLDTLDNAGTCHVAREIVTYDSVAPVARVTFGLVTGRDTRTRARWSATDATSPVQSYDVVVARRGSTADYMATGTVGTLRTTGWLVAGGTYLTTVRARDVAGNVGSTVQLSLTVPNDDRSLIATGQWQRSTLASDYLGSHLRSGTRGSMATFRRTGRIFTVGVLTTPTAGWLDVYVDGVRTGYDLYEPTLLRLKQLVVARFTRPGSHAVRLVVRGTHRAESAGSNVYLDSFTVVP